MTFYQQYALELAEEYETAVEDAVFDCTGKPYTDFRVVDALRGQYVEIENLNLN